MMTEMPVDPQPSRSDPFNTVVETFLEGWGRMRWLLFLHPAVSLRDWFRWGSIVFLAGATPLALNFEYPLSTGQQRAVLRELRSWLDSPLALCAALAAVALVSAVLGYVVCRFRVIFVAAVASGDPGIRPAWRSTVSLGREYFLFCLQLMAATLLALIPALVGGVPLALATWQQRVPSVWAVVAACTALAWAVVVVLGAAVLNLWSVDLALPQALFHRVSLRQALSIAGRRSRAQVGRVLLYFGARLAVSFLFSLVAGCALCATCCLWAGPGLLGAAMTWSALRLGGAWWLALPVALIGLIFSAWAVSLLLCPLALTTRAWSLAFAQRLSQTETVMHVETAPPPTQTL